MTITLLYQLPSTCISAPLPANRGTLPTPCPHVDPTGLVYAADAQLLPADSPAIRGRAAIQAFWQGCWDMGIGTVERTPSEMDCLLDTINEVGGYRILDRQGRVVDVGNYVVIWKQQQGQWQIHRDIWTSDLPVNSPLSLPSKV